ncbi:SUF system NifU family Fe-S cluster assembly protein [Agromyces badenianii]|uniref:SUF system NifU family Fe-S cluster assembly protein n=1 Tax=Agromyces badenianii TaxID=2080742 RepID=A0A2S0WTK1_9MICO|nr:SUF system NifU family Fe-S cluster assembly protein [Agromyces badenianii]AWB94673.1 SUF system NifU family Fe-S cluster assembly protein [Agromyces badenianii]
MSDLSGLYQELILDHSRRRLGDGELAEPHATHHELNPTCGDEITMGIRLDASGTAIEAIGWTGDGCSISMASASALTELAAGADLDRVRQLVDAFRTMMRSQGAGEADEELLGDAIAFHGVSKYVMRVKCAMLAWVALEACVAAARAGTRGEPDSHPSTTQE